MPAMSPLPSLFPAWPQPSRRFHTHRFSPVLVFATVLAVGLPGCSKAHKPAAPPKPSASATPSPSPSPTAGAQADFHAEGVAAVDAQNRAASNDVANAASRKVLDVIDAYYNIAFLQPSRWAGGGHPDLPGLFSDDAKASV